MSYCNTSTIITILPGLPQATTTNGWTETNAVIHQHMIRADGIIDGYCARRYSLPFSPVPPMIRAISNDLVCYYTYRSFYTQDNHNKSEYFEELYGQAREDLKMIREGDIDLVDTSGSDATPTTNDELALLDSTTYDYQSFFDVDDTLEWKFDTDLEDSISGNR